MMTTKASLRRVRIDHNGSASYVYAFDSTGFPTSGAIEHARKYGLEYAEVTLVNTRNAYKVRGYTADVTLEDVEE
jgi:hypothetical protein